MSVFHYLTFSLMYKEVLHNTFATAKYESRHKKKKINKKYAMTTRSKIILSVLTTPLLYVHKAV